MASPRDALIDAIEHWLDDEARERVARARGDVDADPPAVVAARHAGLRGPRTRENFEEARERGLFGSDEIAFVAAALRDAFAAVGRARALERVREVLARRVPHDSDHHAPAALFERMLGEAHAGRRRAIAQSLEAFAPALVHAMREGRADVEESLEGASWLRDVPPPPDAVDDAAFVEPARELLRATDEIFTELCDRLAHAAKAPIETFADLAFTLRAPHLDDRFDPRRRWRRAAAHFDALGVPGALNKRARVEAVSTAELRLRTAIVARDVPRDVRLLPPTIELGLASERDAIEALGRAVAVAWRHPALPPLVARAPSSAGDALGALFSHLMADRRFHLVEGLAEKETRLARELALAFEITALRTEAAGVVARATISSSSFADDARELLRETWRADVGPAVAACVALSGSASRLRALRWAPPIFVALRERYDEDWWRNPRASEALRAGCERGATLTVEAWAQELGAAPEALSGRLAELLA